jgi:hypothetical protein
MTNYRSLKKEFHTKNTRQYLVSVVQNTEEMLELVEKFPICT